MTTTCPYCQSSKSLLFGQVFCSRHHASMEALDSGTLFIKTKKLEETAEHISRLSIRLMLNGEQYYKVGNRECLVTSHNFLVINQGQQYKTAFSGTHELEMMMVGFQPGMAEDLMRNLTSTHGELLDNPFIIQNSTHFFEQTFALDPVIQQKFMQLRRLLDEPLAARQSVDLDAIYTDLLERLIVLQYDIREQINQIALQRRAVREEIYHRLNIAREYIEAHYQQTLSVPDIARVATLSPHHFKRLFKQAYHITPHQFLIQKRLEAAQRLLFDPALSIHDICNKVGFENTSSFIRLFKKYYKTTPGQRVKFISTQNY